MVIKDGCIFNTIGNIILQKGAAPPFVNIYLDSLQIFISQTYKFGCASASIVFIESRPSSNIEISHW